MSRSDPHPHVTRALAYAKDVVAGRTLACEWVRLACKRHLEDLKRSKSKTYGFLFDHARAERACQFAELFPHVKGHWAIPQPGKPDATKIRLESWQCFIRCSIYGWVEKAKPIRRFTTAYIEVPRKNAKSTLGAIDGLQFFAADGEMGAEIYSGATTEKQAWEVFRPAKQMAERSPEFLEAYGVVVNAASLVIPGNGSRFEPIIGKPGDGASPSLAITDEYHEHPDSTQYDTMVTGMGARRQPLMLTITTAGENMEGPCYALHERVQRMLKGTEPDERLFGIIYTIDEQDDWTTEEALRKANPNFDVSVSGDFLRRQQQTAIASSRDQNIFKTKHLNIWVTARAAWLNMEWWHRQQDATLRLEDFRGEACWLGLDLASKIDLAAKVRVFRRIIEGASHYYAFGQFYVPESTVQDPRNRHYQGWVKDGHLIATEGEAIDQERIKGDILADGQTFEVRELGFDQWGATKLIQELQGVGLPVVEIPQNVKHLSEPMKLIEAAIKAGTFHHDGNPCFTWMMGNVTVKPDANENIFPRKERPENKIDGAVALIMAFGRAALAPEEAAALAVDFIDEAEET